MVGNVQQVQERLRRADPGGEPVGLPALGRRRDGRGRVLQPPRAAQRLRPAARREQPGGQRAQRRRRRGGGRLPAGSTRSTPRSVGEIHLAGYHDGGDIVIDDHGSRVHDAVWQVYRHALRRLGAAADAGRVGHRAAAAARCCSTRPTRPAPARPRRWHEQRGAAPADAAARVVGRRAARRGRGLAARRAAAHHARPAGLPRQCRCAGRARARRRLPDGGATRRRRLLRRAGARLLACRTRPRRATSREWGAALPAFIAAAPQLAESPTWPTVARLDWAVHQAEQAADSGGAVDRAAASGRVRPGHAGAAPGRRCGADRLAASRWPASGRPTAATRRTDSPRCARPSPAARVNRPWCIVRASRCVCRPCPRAPHASCKRWQAARP